MPEDNSVFYLLQEDSLIQKLTVEMRNAAKILEFEHAAYLRDKISRLKAEGR